MPEVKAPPIAREALQFLPGEIIVSTFSTKESYGTFFLTSFARVFRLNILGKTFSCEEITFSGSSLEGSVQDKAVRSFIETQTECVRTFDTPFPTVYQAYVHYSDALGVPPLPRQRFSRFLRTFYPTYLTRSVQNVRFCNLTLKP